MELWIRSQDKRELVKTNDIYLVIKDTYFHIYCYANNSDIDLGQYGDFEDKTRALEVLDEIQKFIIREDELSYVQSAEGIEIQSVTERGVVFEMPKE